MDSPCFTRTFTHRVLQLLNDVFGLSNGKFNMETNLKQGKITLYHRPKGRCFTAILDKMIQKIKTTNDADLAHYLSLLVQDFMVLDYKIDGTLFRELIREIRKAEEERKFLQELFVDILQFKLKQEEKNGKIQDNNNG